MFIANTKFTDREDYKKIPIDAITSTHHAEHSFVKTFYGGGGQGKKFLCIANLYKEFIKKNNITLSFWPHAADTLYV